MLTTISSLIVSFHVDLQIWSKKPLISKLSTTFQTKNLNFKIYQKYRQSQKIITNYLQLYRITHISHIAKKSHPLFYNASHYNPRNIAKILRCDCHIKSLMRLPSLKFSRIFLTWFGGTTPLGTLLHKRLSYEIFISRRFNLQIFYHGFWS